MEPENRIIDNNRFLFYADYLALLAEAGIEKSRSAFKSINAAARVSVSSFDIKTEVDLSKNNLLNTVRTAYETMFNEANSIDAMSGSFRRLAEHIKFWTSQDIDAYLTSEGITVSSVYANISGLLNNPVSSDNIRD